ncbi:UAA transporter family [Aggregatibacter actinomycetemcomitans serotype e str. SC1083]|uniref:UAA transporter family n=2 Tax=Aggregatibacter actinomycetemcomitans TaxID=714 RepID=G4A7M0_AGGAC|nr:UAA transporter family [Aggregatibacter actinomycetemcomitans serotype e str. SC1083]
MIFAYISIALMGVFVKYASDELPSSEILFSRFLIGFIFLLPFMIRDGDFKVELSQWPFLVMRNLAGIASMLLTFYAIKYLPISIAVLLMNTSALFVPLLLFVLRTRTPLKVLACSFLGFAGVSIIMLADSAKHFELLHIGYALGAAFLAAMAFISLQELNKHNSPKNIVFYFHLLGSLLLPLFFAAQWEVPTVHGLLLLLLVGGFGLIFQLLLTRAFKYAPANVITPFAFTGVIFSSICDWLFWYNVPTLNFWIGSLVIILSVSLLAKMRR